MDQGAKCPRRIKASSPGGPKGVITSHGTSSAYQPKRCVCQGAAAGTANLSLQRLRAAISGSELQPTLLPRAGMSEEGASLAGDQAAAEHGVLVAEGRQQHAEAERQRRQRKASQAGSPQASQAATTDAAAESRAWSRSEKHPEVFCDRPGCYQPVRNSPRAPARYCSDACRAAVERARDRERKWLLRNREVGRFKRRLEYEAARAKRCGGARPSRQPCERTSFGRCRGACRLRSKIIGRQTVRD